MRISHVVTGAAVAALSTLPACSASVQAPVVAVPAAPVVVQYAAIVKPMVATKQVIHLSSNPALCVDVKGDNASQHALVRLSSCHGRENQRWSFGPGVAGAVQVGGIGGLCLGVPAASGAVGGETEIDTCNGSPRQQFRFYVDGRIRELATQTCLTAGGPEGRLIVLAPCDAANPAQIWAVQGS
jgi:Ricin-type beta-trefoil lectin domain